MVKSKINPEKVNYKESKDIDEEDLDYSSPLYDYKLFNHEIVIALGKQRHTYSKYDIVHFPIYLILHNIPRAQIGVFEVDSNKLIDILDEDGDVKLSAKHILFYATKDYIDELIKKYEENDKNKEEDELDELEKHTDFKDELEDANIADEVEVLDDVLSLKATEEKKMKSHENAEEELKDGLFKENPNAKPPAMLDEEGKGESNEIKSTYKESPRNNWLVKFMKNNNYDIVDNEGGGDCFFAVIRDAFRQVGKDTTVEKLRASLSKEATENMYQESRTLYLNFLSELQDKEKELKETKKSLTLLKKRMDNVKDKTEHQNMLDQAKKLINDNKRLLIEKKEANELLDEFKHMKDIDTLEKFRAFILTRHYWADTWAVSTLEKILNVKIILLSEEAYDSGDMDSVMQCGQLNDTELEDIGKFVPDYYIMACYTGNHYKLVTYKEKGILKFREIPYDVKIMIVNKCLEKNSGPYYLIQDFKNFKTKIGLHANEGEPEEKEDEYLVADLYNRDTIFSFYSSSNGKVKPGKGSGESIKPNDIVKFNVLSSIKDWRKKLDDSWVTPFNVDGHRWSSAEHYFLGAQFKKGFPDFYLKFSLDSNSDISKDIELAKIAGSKSGKTKDKVLREDKIKIDPDFFTIGKEPVFEAERKKALIAKFNQNLDLKNMLLETKDAKLVHFERGKGHIPDMMLMKVRRELAQ